MTPPKPPLELWISLLHRHDNNGHDPAWVVSTKPFPDAYHMKEVLDTDPTDAEKDYKAMREFQAKFIASDHENIALKSALKQAREALDYYACEKLTCYKHKVKDGSDVAKEALKSIDQILSGENK